jgi:hypothetical protein
VAAWLGSTGDVPFEQLLEAPAFLNIYRNPAGQGQQRIFYATGGGYFIFNDPRAPLGVRIVRDEQAAQGKPQKPAVFLSRQLPLRPMWFSLTSYISLRFVGMAI